MIAFASVIETSVFVAVAATALVALAGTPVAYALARPNWPGKPLVEVVTNLPLLLPPSVVGYYLLAAFDRRGPLLHLLEVLGIGSPLFTRSAAVLAAFLVSFPLYVQALRSSLAAVDPQLREAARVDGAGRLAEAFWITWPLARGGFAAGVLLTAARSMGEFGATLVVAGNIPGRTQTLGLAVYTALQSGEERLAHALSFVALSVGSAIAWLALRLQPKT